MTPERDAGKAGPAARTAMSFSCRIRRSHEKAAWRRPAAARAPRLASQAISQGETKPTKEIRTRGLAVPLAARTNHLAVVHHSSETG